LTEQRDIFLSLLESHKGIIYRIANAYCKDPLDREDVIQEIIIQLWTSLKQYNSKYKESTWVYRIALNTAISYYRKTKIQKENTSTLAPIIESSMKSEDSIEEHPDLHLLKHFIEQLGEIDKSLILLYLDGQQYHEIAQIMGFTLTNVSSRISRIKKTLKRKFEKLKP